MSKSTSVSASLLIFVVSCFGGCHVRPEHESIRLSPLLSVEKSHKTKENGEQWSSDQGSACLLVHWDKRATTDVEGYLIKRTNHTIFFPFFDTSETEDRYSKHLYGTVILLLRYDKTERKASRGKH